MVFFINFFSIKEGCEDLHFAFNTFLCMGKDTYTIIGIFENESLKRIMHLLGPIRVYEGQGIEYSDGLRISIRNNRISSPCFTQKLLNPIVC